MDEVAVAKPKEIIWACARALVKQGARGCLDICVFDGMTFDMKVKAVQFLLDKW